jgi:hypothetical protein
MYTVYTYIPINVWFWPTLQMPHLSSLSIYIACARLDSEGMKGSEGMKTVLFHLCIELPRFT